MQHRLILLPLTILNLLLLSCLLIYAQQPLPNGRKLPPSAYYTPVGNMPANLILSSDGRYVLCNCIGHEAGLWCLRLSDGRIMSHLAFPNTPPFPSTYGLYYGLAGTPDNTLYLSEGCNSAIAVVKLKTDGSLSLIKTLDMPVKGDVPAGIALDQRGYLYVAVNMFWGQNDPRLMRNPGQLAIYNLKTHQWVSTTNLNTQLSNFPLAVAVTPRGDRVFVSSERDSAVYVFNASRPTHPMLLKKIITGDHPDALCLNHKATRCYVANAHSDTISVLDVASCRVLATISLRPESLRGLPGITPTGLALSPDETILYATLADLDAVAVISTHSNRLLGLIPTGWYPTSIATSTDGKHLVVANGMGNTAQNPNPLHISGRPDADDYYILNLIHGSVQRIPVPTPRMLTTLTRTVLADAHIPSRSPQTNPLAAISLQAGKIQHVIYVIKENRTFDQVLGDLPNANGDPNLCLFGKEITPNMHALAQRFVLLDNFYCCGEVSGSGWTWSTQGMSNEYVQRNVPYTYSGRGRLYDYEGQNNGYLVGGHPALGPDGKPLPDLLFPKGAKPVPDVAGIPTGRIWDRVRQAGLSYRNYGFFLSEGPKLPGFGQVLPDNYPDVAGLQPPGHDLAGKTDADYRRFDLDYPDSDAPEIWYNRTHDPNCLYPERAYGKYSMPSRIAEWKREFHQMLAKDPTGKAVPAFMTIRLMMDHTAGLRSGAHSPASDVADNDYAVGELVETISHSPIWQSSAIFIIEDDAQDGPDHVDAHRSPCLVISPWIKAHSVDHRFYNTDSVLRTIELLLGLQPMSEYDALANPILDWDTAPHNNAPYTALLPPKRIIAEHNPSKSALKPGSVLYRLVAEADHLDLSHADAAPVQQLNKMIWVSVRGLKSPMPPPRYTLPLPLIRQQLGRDEDK
ncbi:Phosphoesterase family protein [Chthonomonas calidirosea]|uniref:Phosphoesterase family n=1 Tax=Chthonomonas calidirosea (strain DSM 23976 / ICMP 18418 / T49) TaxID=1303518 RepID=S0ETN6_CHTCT|nr:alkaline phosphatase family protein [Chthonomonas calidirosea]CCW34565.1 Phosphoesterase family [Chthonomonas calidirosea T49]CEK14419.1 Phosphoesterase family protein [Chthonomonas calidirosea]